jgi:AraC-like DNA-binding protein
MIICIREMPLFQRNYFRYFPPSRASEAWGLAVTAAGFTTVLPQSPYPPARHPADHDFTWEHGRVLEALQIVLVTNGRGVFESKRAGRIEILAGSAFALMPGEWHRYRPDPQTGWEESWLEIQGSNVERMLRSGVIDRHTTVRTDALQIGLDEALSAVHDRARRELRGSAAELAARGYGVLAAWTSRPGGETGLTRSFRLIAEAERFLVDHQHEPTNVAELARNLGMAYSHFRREFRRHTGFAPWQYVLRLRLTRGRRLLASSGEATLEEIAGKLGFSSAFHFSAAFKQAYGKSPDLWRRELWRGQRGSR